MQSTIPYYISIALLRLQKAMPANTFHAAVSPFQPWNPLFFEGVCSLSATGEALPIYRGGSALPGNRLLLQP